ncbi:Alpha/Beta hydrolase protein [Mycotypha africana]|uniref:Alpha/Beta hydrolase protein n=1 Tax=Mycotypha africana TaxID=64632 RepID=UPI0023010BFF|nr:Alpha/Beta hydrolase protein [Mycotypha africana]KAI8969956.1 Alpha/Beta hydrolase protein [Mycotypha africana]
MCGLIKVFEIPQLDEQELKSKLASVRFPNEFADSEQVGWRCGTPSWAVKELISAWRHNFDWERKRQDLSKLQHYVTEIQNLNLHFVHEPSLRSEAIPIILIHGWPSTFYEFHKLVEPLKSSETQAFHVVLPSLPGYGFSEAPRLDGSCSLFEMAAMFHELMQRLGYEKYMVYGTDWGAMIGTQMANAYPEHCMGFLTNMPSAMPPLPNFRNLITRPYRVFLFILSIFMGVEAIYGKDESKNLSKRAFANCDKDDSAGYRAIQSTRPYTLAYGLTDSPVGLLGWMLEPYHAWSYFDSEEQYETRALPSTITVDEFLTQVTIYWITNTMSSSYRLYYETKKNDLKSVIDLGKSSIKVPVAVSYFENEAFKMPKDWLDVTFKLVQYRTHKKGGHFPALEAPELLLKDISDFAVKIKQNIDGKKTN